MKKLILSTCAISFVSIASFAQPIGCSSQERTPVFDFHKNSYDSTKSRGGADNYYLWDIGTTIKVKFLSGSPALQAKVLSAARVWEYYANLKFEQTYGDDADIRVKLGEGSGHNSYIGTVCRMIDKSQETMNLDTVNMSYSAKYSTAVVQHEFGHAIGLLHEHSSPVSGIKWNKQRLYKLYKIQQGWDKDQVDFQVFRVFNQSYTNGTKYDNRSIMHYPIDSTETLDGYWVDWNYYLSKGDKEIIAALYPKKGKRVNEVARISVSDFTGIDLVPNVKKEGLSLYPSFALKSGGVPGKVTMVLNFYDEYGEALSDNDGKYNQGNSVATVREVFFPKNKNIKYNKNKKKKDFEFFIPWDQIPLEDAGDALVVDFKIVTETIDGEIKELYQSKALSYSNVKKP